MQWKPLFNRLWVSVALPRCFVMLRSKGSGSQLNANSSSSQNLSSKLCSFPYRLCSRDKIDGYDYCIKHILEDKSSSYKQCNYSSSKTGRRCPNAYLKNDRKDNFCSHHAHRAAALRGKANRKMAPPEDPENLLEQLDHPELVASTDSRGKSWVDILTSKFMDYASSSEGDDNDSLIKQCNNVDYDSDSDSVDSDQEDCLRHADVYTAEEVALISRDKLIRLQSLYIDQFKRLQHVLKEKRRDYIQATLKQLNDVTDETVSKRKLTDEERQKLKCMQSYHKRHGKEALLHRQSKERRIALSDTSRVSRGSSQSRCTHSEAGVRCQSVVLPLSKYCNSHILCDPQQILFRRCAFQNGSCQHPIIDIQSEFCLIHSQLNCEDNIDVESEISESHSFVAKSDSLPSEVLRLNFPLSDEDLQESVWEDSMTEISVENFVQSSPDQLI